MIDDAFKILGIESTNDARAIRAAYVRLARIYHPDRFSGMPEDVRGEAERRMKEVTAAYELLRAARRKAAAKAAPARKTRGKKDPWDESRRIREAAAARRLEQERSRLRWLLWEELESQARERADYEASLAVMAERDARTVVRDEHANPEEQQSMLSRRLTAARASR